MKYFISAALLIITISTAAICQTQTVQDTKCAENPDSLYNRQNILEQLAEILNESVPEFKKIYKNGFHVKNEKPIKFFIFDLTDTSNKGTSLDDCVKLRDKHIYHFAAISYGYSFSHILILENGNLKVFRSINCKDRGDSLEDVLNYLSQKLKTDKNKGEIISRVKNYREYGIYYSVDIRSLRCQKVEREKK
jgi:hypothetical protein